MHVAAQNFYTFRLDKVHTAFSYLIIIKTSITNSKRSKVLLSPPESKLNGSESVVTFSKKICFL